MLESDENLLTKVGALRKIPSVVLEGLRTKQWVGIGVVALGVTSCRHDASSSLPPGEVGGSAMERWGPCGFGPPKEEANVGIDERSIEVGAPGRLFKDPGLEGVLV